MSWQRIDENTYIDDTLVTCAEYQLFIDEMREQGKYFQPDHWRSYQFLTGQAREPILGVRPSDAIAFCAWITGREQREWKFRLPRQQELLNFRLGTIKINPLGFWMGDNFRSFAWVNSVYDKVYDIDLSNILIDVRATQHLKFPKALNRQYPHDLVQSVKSVFTEKRLITQRIALVRAIEDLVRLIFIIDKSTDLIDFVEQIEIRGFNVDQDLEYLNYIEKSFTSSRVRVLNRKETLEKLLELVLDLSVLHGRIAGRYPAFEGIRLVKERIR